MDFSYLLELAKANEEKSKKEKSIKFSTKVSTAKKIDKAGPRKEAIEEHLNKIEREKQKKEEEFEKKKNKLLELRSQDKHSKKRVHTLLTRTKGASKSVLDDAKDLSVAKGEAQCDEDDYGYESAMSQQIFNKLQNVYSELPEDERLKFTKKPKSNIEDVKKRVIESLKVKQEEGLGIRKRHRKRKSRRSKTGEDDGFINDGDCYKKFEPPSDEDQEEIYKNLPNHLKEKKSHDEEIKKSKKKKKKDKDISLKPLKEDKYSNFKYNNKSTENQDSSTKKEKSAPKEQILSMSFNDLMKMAVKKQTEPSAVVNPLEEELKNIQKRKEERLKEQRPLTAKERKAADEEKMHKLRKIWRLSNENKKGQDIPKNAANELNNSNAKSNQPETKIVKPANGNEKTNKNPLSNHKESSKAPNMVLDKSKYFAVPSSPKSSSKLKDALTSLKAPPKLHSSSKNIAVHPKGISRPSSHSNPHFQSSKSFPRSSSTAANSHASQDSKRKVRDDSDEDEYDSELDDFIVDSEGEMDYSSEIAKMFKYDKSKYSHVDEDVDDMEVSYAQLQKEEKRSAKIGLMEDLEDMRKEEEERKRKMMMKKKQR